MASEIDSLITDNLNVKSSANIGGTLTVASINAAGLLANSSTGVSGSISFNSSTNTLVVKNGLIVQII